MTLADGTCKLDDGLHPLDLTLDILIKVLLLDLRETEEVN
jgi:hypothetical protein